MTSEHSVDIWIHLDFKKTSQQFNILISHSRIHFLKTNNTKHEDVIMSFDFILLYVTCNHVIYSMEILYICLGTQRNRDTYVKMEWPLILCTDKCLTWSIKTNVAVKST